MHYLLSSVMLLFIDSLHAWCTVQCHGLCLFTPCMHSLLASVMLLAYSLLACIPRWPLSCSLLAYSLHAFPAGQCHALCLLTPCMHYLLSSNMLSAYLLLACIICCPVSCLRAAWGQHHKQCHASCAYGVRGLTVYVWCLTIPVALAHELGQDSLVLY